MTEPAPLPAAAVPRPAAERLSRSDWARRHPLLTPFPVVVSAVATFLVVLAFLAGQMRAGHDPALGAGQRPALVASSGHGGRRIVTRTSGGQTVSTSTGSGASTGSTGHAHALVTTTSGAGESRGDD